MKDIIKKLRNKRKPDSSGYTLVEVLAAFLLLLMVSQMLLLGISFAAKVETRTEQMEEMRRGIGTHLAELDDCIAGTVRLKLDGECDDIEEQGWLYTGSEHDSSANVQIVWVDEGDFVRAEDVSEELPE